MVLRFVMTGGGQGKNMKDPQANQKQAYMRSLSGQCDVVWRLGKPFRVVKQCEENESRWVEEGKLKF